jgi:hypothetical protein
MEGIKCEFYNMKFSKIRRKVTRSASAAITEAPKTAIATTTTTIRSFSNHSIFYYSPFSIVMTVMTPESIRHPTEQ